MSSSWGKGTNGCDETREQSAAVGEVDEEIVRTDVEAFQALTDDERQLMENAYFKAPDDAHRIMEARIMAREMNITEAMALALLRDSDVGLSGGVAVYGDYSEYEQYLNPTRDLIRTGEETVPGMTDAAENLLGAIARGEQIAIFTDYDTDGSSSAGVMTLALDAAGHPRDKQTWGYARGGFGLTDDFVDKAIESGATQLVIMDCGSSQVSEVNYAVDRGLTVTIIDHHNVKLENAAQFHVNPKWEGEARQSQAEELLSVVQGKDKLYRSALELQQVAGTLKMQWQADREGTHTAMEEMTARVREMMVKLDETRGAQTPSPNFLAALEGFYAHQQEQIVAMDALSGVREASPHVDAAMAALKDRIPEMTHLHTENSAAQLVWKFGATMQQVKDGEVDEDWYGRALWIAGNGALGDSMPMRRPENRAFARIPSGQPELVPPTMRIICEELGEDPDDLPSIFRMRAVQNLPKRTSLVSAELTHRALTEQDPKEARKLATELLAEKQKSDEVMQEMTEKAMQAHRERLARYHAEGKEPQFGFVALDGYPEHKGKAGQIAPKLSKLCNDLPFMVIVDDKASARGGEEGILGLFQEEKGVKEASTVTATNRDGSVRQDVTAGGHQSVFASSVPKENREKMEKEAEKFAWKLKQRGRWSRDPAPLREKENSAPRGGKVCARLVDAQDFRRMEEESKQLKPLPMKKPGRSNPKPILRVTTAVKPVTVGEFDLETNGCDALLQLPDKSTVAAKVPEHVGSIMRKTGTWFEGVFDMPESRDAYYVWAIKPIP